MIAVDLAANLFGVAPVQLTNRPDPLAVAVTFQVPGIHGASLTTPGFVFERSAPTVLVPAEVRAAPNPAAPYAYRDAIQSYIADEEAAIAAKGLAQRPENRSIAMFHPGAAPRGVVLMLHGLDDGPKQWSAMTERLYDLGYDVFAPNLPGHGIRDASGSDNLSLIPGARGYEDWNRFTDRMFDLAKGSGQVSVVGLSAGGMLSLKLAERHASELGADGKPIMQQVVAISPLLALAGDFAIKDTPVRLGPIHLTNERAAEALGTAETLFGAPVDSFLKGQAIDMKGPNPPTAYGSRYVNQDVVLGLVRAADQTKLHGNQLKALPKGVELVISMADVVVDPSTNLEFARAIGAGTYVFPKSAAVPHAMIYPPENPDQASADRVRDLVVERLSR